MTKYEIARQLNSTKYNNFDVLLKSTSKQIAQLVKSGFIKSGFISEHKKVSSDIDDILKQL